MKTEIEIINEAGHILLDPSKRCIRNFAQTSNGLSTPPESEYACCFCLVGAIERAGQGVMPELYTWRNGTSIANYISAGAVDVRQNGLLSVYWDHASPEEQTACAQRMIDYKGLQ